MPTVSLRPLTDDDAQTIAIMGNNKLIADNMRDVFPHPYHAHHAVAFINNVKQQNPTRVFGIVANDILVGTCGIFPADDVYRNSAEVGYWLGQDYWGQGIALQALNLLVDYGFNTLGMHRIYASVFEPNTASAKVLQKAGFIHEGTRRQSVYKNGQHLNELLFAKLKND